MIKWLGSRVLWGMLFILGGVLFLLENLGVFQGSGLFWAVVLALGGIFFLVIYRGIQSNWWAIIPGVTLLGIALLILLDELLPAFDGDIGGVIVLGSIGIAFLLIYITNRAYWWALIPAGVMFSISLMLVSEIFTPNIDSGGIILMGIGLTFAIVALLPNLQIEMRWAWIPAIVLGVIGALIAGASINVLDYLLPAGLILLGLILLWRMMKNRSPFN